MPGIADPRGQPMPLAPQQLAAMQQAASTMPLPPPVRAAMAQIAHLPPAQQQVLFAQIMAHHTRMRQQMGALGQQPGQKPGPPGPPPPGPPPPGAAGGAPPQSGPPPPRAQAPQMPAKVGKRMTGSELQLIIRHQSLQLQVSSLPPRSF